jgi:hypothetical protein
MKMCERLKAIFKSSSDNKEKKVSGGKLVFGDVTDKELVSLSIDELKNKCEKEKKKLIKKISSLSKDQRANKYAEISKGMELFKELNLYGKLAGNLTIKYNFVYDCIKEYHAELKKSIDQSE